MLTFDHQVMDRSRLNALHYPMQASSLPYFSSSSYLSDGEINAPSILPAERQVGFWKGDQEAVDHSEQQGRGGYNSAGEAIGDASYFYSGSNPSQNGGSRSFQLQAVSEGDFLDSFQGKWQGRNGLDWSGPGDQPSKAVYDRLAIGAERNIPSGPFSWSGTGDVARMAMRDHCQTAVDRCNDLQDGSATGPSRVVANDYGNSVASIFGSKLTLETSESSSHALDDDASRGKSDRDGEHEQHYGSLEELESQTIGRLLPDDEEELFAGIVEEYDKRAQGPGPGVSEEGEDFDLFSSGGGLELEGEGADGSGSGMRISGSQQGNAGTAGSAGEHPFGEHPSRTLFVRNINSNVEDTELRALFEQYGDIRTLYTACKHRGFVMISYYDIRAARAAMRALQNKPLRRRKLDIHFSIPKENPSDKDVNQGTLVVFNLDASVSNDELRQIFGVYGEVKEIRETPNKRHHKFVEFYDVRAAEAALRALNRSDIAGKRIKLEPSRPGGARRSLMHQLGPDGEQDESQSINGQLSSSLTGSPPLSSSIWGSCGSLSDAALLGSRTLNRGHSSSSSLVSALYRSLSSAQVTASGNGLVGSLGAVGSNLRSSSPARAASTSSLVGLQSQHEAISHLVAASHLGGQSKLPPQHLHSVPDVMNGMLYQGQYGQGSALASAAAAAAAAAGSAARAREGLEGSGRMLRASSTSALGTADSSLQHVNSGVPSPSLGGHHYPMSGSLGGASGSSSSTSGSQSFMWGTSGSSSSFRQSLPSQGSSPAVWPSAHDLPFLAANGQEQAIQHSLRLEQAYSQSLQNDAAAYNSVHANALDQAYQAALEQSYSQSVARSSHSLVQSHSRSRAQALSSHMLSCSRSHAHLALPRGMLASHHVGSDPLLLTQHYSFLSESPESHVRAGSLGALGSGLGISVGAGGGGGSSMRENGPERSMDRYRLGALSTESIHDNGPPSPSVLSPQVRMRTHSATTSAAAGQAQTEAYTDRSRGRQREQGSGEGKKQFQLDVERILQGDDIRTTLMVKNIPNKYTQKMLLAAIDESHKGSYDFFYLPIDFKNKCNVGYAFINMVDPYKIVPFFQAFNGKKWEKFNSEKVATLAYARIQGKNALVAHFQNSSLMNEDKRCRPILFHSEGPHAGDQEPFPVGMNVRPAGTRPRSNGVSSSHQGSPANSTSSRDDSNHGGTVFGSGSAGFGGSFLRPGSTRGRDGEDLSPEY